MNLILLVMIAVCIFMAGYKSGQIKGMEDAKKILKGR